MWVGNIDTENQASFEIPFLSKTADSKQIPRRYFFFVRNDCGARAGTLLFVKNKSLIRTVCQYRKAVNTFSGLFVDFVQYTEQHI